MPAPASVTYSTAALVDAMTAVLAEIDSGTTSSIFIYTEADVLLASIPLNATTAGTVDANGVLTLDITGPDLSANSSGVATWAAVANDLGTVVSFPAKSGSAAEAGYLVMSTTTIALGEQVEIISAVLG